jgi:hypothetical protein
MGNTAPVAMLVSAFELYEKENPKSDVNMRKIKSEELLLTAVNNVIEAASQEFSIDAQRLYLKAASFGKVKKKKKSSHFFSV